MLLFENPKCEEMKKKKKKNIKGGNDLVILIASHTLSPFNTHTDIYISGVGKCQTVQTVGGGGCWGGGGNTHT